MDSIRDAAVRLTATLRLTPAPRLSPSPRLSAAPPQTPAPIRAFSSKFDFKSVSELSQILKQDDEASSSMKLEVLRVEKDFRQYMGEPVPEVVTPEMWKELANTPSDSERRALWYRFANRDALRRLNSAEKLRHSIHVQEWRRELMRRHQAENAESGLAPREGFSSVGPILSRLFSRIDEKIVKETHLQRSAHFAALFGQPLLFDFGVEGAEMNNKLVRDMKAIYKRNLIHWEPFDIHLCGIDGEEKFEENPPHDPRLNRLSAAPPPPKFWSTSASASDSSFLDLFPKEKMVYLSPESPVVLDRYAHDDVYVICAVSDPSHRERCAGISRAKSLGLRTARFNVEPYFFKRKKANFSVVDVFEALVDARDTDGNWPYSFRRLPRTERVEWRVADMRHYDFERNQFRHRYKGGTDGRPNERRDRKVDRSPNGWTDSRLIKKDESAFENRRSISKPKWIVDLGRLRRRRSPKPELEKKVEPEVGPRQQLGDSFKSGHFINDQLDHSVEKDDEQINIWVKDDDRDVRDDTRQL